MPSGFLYNIKAIVDKESFQQGIRELEKLEQSSQRMLKGIAGLGAAAIGSATIAGKVAQEELKVARAIGVSSEALSSWKIAANVAGASASGLIGTLSSLENKMQHLKIGQVDRGLARNLGLMGIGYGDFAKMSSEDRMRSVFNKADSMKDQELAATLIGDILGQAGKDYYDSLKLAGKSFDEQVNEARKLNFVTERNRREASLFAIEMRGVKEAGKSITLLLGSEIGAALTPTVRKVKNYLIDNRNAIQKGITGTVQTVGAAFNAIAGAIGKVAPYVEGLIDKFGGLDKVIIKVGLGFATIKFMQVAGGITSIIRGVNLLKVAMGGLTKGLLGGALYLIFDDLITHFQGGESFIFDDLLPALEKLKEDLGFGDVDFSKLVKGLQDITVELGKLAGNSLKTSIELLKDLASIIKALIEGDTEKLGRNIKQFFTDWSDGMKEMFNVGNATDAAKQAYEDSIKNGKSKNEASVNAMDAFQRKIPFYGVFYSAETEFFDKLLGNKSSKGTKNDAVFTPDGRVTSVSPDDWLFAVKNVSDLAGAFYPGVTNNTQNDSAIIINQNFTIENARGGEAGAIIKQQAYRGTSDALTQNLRNGMHNLQLMSGTR